MQDTTRAPALMYPNSANPHMRDPASANPDAIDQLCDAVISKLAEKIGNTLLPKQAVASSSLVSRSTANKQRLLIKGSLDINLTSIC